MYTIQIWSNCSYLVDGDGAESLGGGTDRGDGHKGEEGEEGTAEHFYCLLISFWTKECDCEVMLGNAAKVRGVKKGC